MTKDEATKFFDEQKAQGKTDDDILGTLYLMFQGGDLELDELEALINVLGYEFTDEFKAMSPEDQKTKGVEKIDEDVSEEDVEDAKEYDDEEESEDEDEDEDEEDDSEEDEEESDDKKAAKLFGFNK